MPLKRYKLSLLTVSALSVGDKNPKFNIEGIGEVELPSEDVHLGAMIHMDDGRMLTIRAITMKPRHYVTALGVQLSGTVPHEKPQPEATNENKN